MKVLLHLGRFFKQQKKHCIIGIALLVCVSLLQLLPSKNIGIIVDTIATDSFTVRGLTSRLGSCRYTYVCCMVLLTSNDFGFSRADISDDAREII